MPEVKMIPKLIFTLDAWSALQGFLRLAPKEIHGFGRVKPFGSDFLCDKIYLLKQTVTSVHAHMDQADIAAFVGQLMEDGEDPNEVKLCWHSHVRMGRFWSQEDHDNYRQLVHDYLFSLVGTNDGQVKVRLDMATPQMVIDDIAVDIDFADDAIWDWCRAEMADKVMEAPPTPIQKATRRVSKSKVAVPIGPSYNEGEPFWPEDEFPGNRNVIFLDGPGGYGNSTEWEDGYCE